MKGWITWLAAACTAGLGLVSVVNGDTETGLQQLAFAGGMIGLGRKIEKNSPAANGIEIRGTIVDQDSPDWGQLK